MLIEIFKLIEEAIRKNEKKLIVILKDYKRSCVSVNLPYKTLSKLGLTFARSREEIISSSVRARGPEREGSAFSPSSPPWVVCTVAGMATLPPLLFLSLPHLFLSLTLRISLELSSGKVFRPQLFRTRGLPLAGSRSLLKTSDISLTFMKPLLLIQSQFIYIVLDLNICFGSLLSFFRSRTTSASLQRKV